MKLVDKEKPLRWTQYILDAWAVLFVTVSVISLYYAIELDRLLSGVDYLFYMYGNLDADALGILDERDISNSNYGRVLIASKATAIFTSLVFSILILLAPDRFKSPFLTDMIDKNARRRNRLYVFSISCIFIFPYLLFFRSLNCTEMGFFCQKHYEDPMYILYFPISSIAFLGSVVILQHLIFSRSR